METPNSRPRILVVDESRMVRALIIKQIREFYDFREEADGEAAWQVLVLDQSVELVICSLSLPVLSGDDLLVRVRSSRLARLSQMPMLMIAGDNTEVLERAKSHGASDFISRNTVAAELLARIDSLLKLAQARNQLRENLEQNVQNPETGLFTRKYIELQAVQAMSHAMRHGGEVSVMVMGFDNVGELREVHGAEAVTQLQKRFAAMFVGKIRKEDSFGHYLGSQLVVISPGTSYPDCESFGNRLCRAIREASIAIRGQRLNLTVSIGVSNSPVDSVSSAGALIELAGSRLKAAQQEGGDRVVACHVEPSAAVEAMTVERALELVGSGHEGEVVPHLPALGQQLLPLLRLLERDLKLGVLIAELEKALPGADSKTKDVGGVEMS